MVIYRKTDLDNLFLPQFVHCVLLLRVARNEATPFGVISPGLQSLLLLPGNLWLQVR